MDYEIVKVAPNLSGVFPAPFKGDAADVVAINWRGDLYTGKGKTLAEKTGLTDFCSRVGIKPKAKKPSRGHKRFLFEFRDRHFPKKVKKKAKAKEKKPPRELTPAERRHLEVLERLQAEFPSRSSAPVDSRRDRRRKSGGRARTKFAMEDKHGKPAEAICTGPGKFEPVRDREMGIKSIARNRWAARQITERYHQIDTELVAEALKAEEADSELLRQEDT